MKVFSKNEKLPGLGKIQAALASFEKTVADLSEGIDKLAERKTTNQATIDALREENASVEKEIKNADTVRTQLNALLNKK